jgi:Mismatch repair ATPase (MutS family)
MKPYLLFKSYNDKSRDNVKNQNDLIEDLNLKYIFKAMAHDDEFLYDTVNSVMLDSLTDINTIIYRQEVLKDCISNNSIVNELYSIASDAIDEAAYYIEYNKPNYAKMISVSVKVFNSVGLLELLTAKLEKIRALVTSDKFAFQSKGMNKLCSQLGTFLTEEFFKRVRQHIIDLRSTTEGTKIIIGSRLGNGMKGCGHSLRNISKSSSKDNSKMHFLKKLEQNVIYLDNTNIINSAREIEDAALVHILRQINHFNEVIMNFLNELCYECGFYVGCLNLYSAIKQLNAEISFPVPVEIDKRSLIFDQLYDLSLLINEGINPVTNDLNATNKSLFIITGANQGGKSTFLRSVGVSQLMMQCGLFVPAAYYSANVSDNIFTHFTREEDASMNSGKLDEELLRMNNIVERLTPNSMLLMNEPFATTTERDGSKIASDIVTALFESNIKILFVTHLFEFADFMYNKNLDMAMFLRAERNQNGSRSFCIRLGKPLQTSYGEDLYNNVI